MLRPWLFSLFALLFIQSVSATKVQVIYGDDNRKDYYQETNSLVRQQADSTVALIRTQDLTALDSLLSGIRTVPFGANRGMCTSEPFYEQETAAFCSGFLVAPDTIVTAGHCIRTQDACSTTSFVFGFKLNEAGVLPRSVPTNNIYSCRTLVHSVALSNGEDFAVIKLDRAVTEVEPLPLRTSGRIEVGTGLSVVGHPSGLPMKIAGGATVRTVKDQYLIANLDTYGGNSGSAVFNEETGAVEGILVRGETDYVMQGNCRVSKRCADTGCRGEDVTLIERALPYLN